MASTVDLRVSPDAAGAIDACAAHLAARATETVAARGVVHIGLSGGGTGVALYRALAASPVDWTAVHLYQIDERVAPDGDRSRNATGLLHELVARVAIPLDHVHLMDVTALDLRDAADAYAHALPALDLVHLGLGPDGHTASWPPDQPAARTSARRVTATQPFNGQRRLTLTERGLADAGHVVWLVCGADKQDVLRRAIDGDETLPAAHAFALRSGADPQVVFADEAASPG